VSDTETSLEVMKKLALPCLALPCLALPCLSPTAVSVRRIYPLSMVDAALQQTLSDHKIQIEIKTTSTIHTRHATCTMFAEPPPIPYCNNNPQLRICTCVLVPRTRNPHARYTTCLVVHVVVPEPEPHIHTHHLRTIQQSAVV
jgi:hypothetical protein